MPISKHDYYWNPKKSPYNFERYDSKLESYIDLTPFLVPPAS
jgi:hypothetical protein